jgi:predicted secreted hydrolase
MKRPHPLLVVLFAMPLLASGFAWREALPGYSYQFPRDHFEHEDFRTEWWYYTGNVTDERGERFGFELVFFREGERHPDENSSAWAVQDLYLAHAALTDATGKKFMVRRTPESRRTRRGRSQFREAPRLEWKLVRPVGWGKSNPRRRHGHFRFHLS